MGRCRGAGLGAREQKGCCEVVSLRNVRSYTLKVSPIWLTRQELTKNSINSQATRVAGAHEASPQDNDQRGPSLSF